MAMVVTGLNAVTGSFVASAVTVQKDAWEATKTAAAAIRSAQRADVPVYEGTTRASVRANSSQRAGEVRASIGATHYVARFLQHGTVRMSPKMDLYAASQPGIDSWLDRLEDIAKVV